MKKWYRIFSREKNRELMAILTKELQSCGNSLEFQFTCDPDGDLSTDWFTLAIRPTNKQPIILERYLVEEEGIRSELNSWAGILETWDHDPVHVLLMEKVIQGKELITVEKPQETDDELAMDDLCMRISRVIADATDGVFQVDGVGFYDASGALLLGEK